MCGCKLMTPDDTRAFALKVPADARHYETSDELATRDVRELPRNREWATATAPPRQMPHRRPNPR